MEALFADLPTNAIAQDNLLLEKAAAVSALYSAFYKRRSQDSQEAIKAKLPSILGGAVGFVGDKMGNMMDMNETEIKKYARENNASYREYVLGVIQGTYKSPKRAMLDNQVEVLNNFSQQMYESREHSRQIIAEQRQIAAARQTVPQPQIAAPQPQQVNYLERSRQIEAERQATLKQIQQERHQRELEKIKNNAPQYVAAGGGGASSHTCADCTYYSAGAGKCAYKDYKTNAGDSCGFFRWK